MNQPTIIECIQGSPEWMACRLGCVTSSRVAPIVEGPLTRNTAERKKGEERKTLENLRIELAGEILTGQLSSHYVSRWMEEGRDKEKFARAAYEFIKGVQTVQIGFAYHPKIKMAGCSPDAIVGPEGGAEFKCPKTETHLRYLTAGVVPKEYMPQMYWQMACMGWEWNDFVSHDPSFKQSKHRTLIVRLHRDEKIIREMEEKVMRFNDEVQEYILKLDPDYLLTKLKASVDQAKRKKAQQQDPSMLIQDEDFKYLCPR
jgi:hypothetical protein